MNILFWHHNDRLSYQGSYSLAGVFRHNPMCLPGQYRVVFCMDPQWGAPNCNAVVDDFGNLIKVSE